MFKNMSGNIPGGHFSGGSLMGGNFPGGSFPDTYSQSHGYFCRCYKSCFKLVGVIFVLSIKIRRFDIKRA